MQCWQQINAAKLWLSKQRSIKRTNTRFSISPLIVVFQSLHLSFSAKLPSFHSFISSEVYLFFVKFLHCFFSISSCISLSLHSLYLLILPHLIPINTTFSFSFYVFSLFWGGLLLSVSHCYFRCIFALFPKET